MDSFWSVSPPNTVYIFSQVAPSTHGALPLVCGPGWRTHRRDCTLRCRTWTDESGCTAAPLGWSSHSRAAETKADMWKRWIPKQNSILLVHRKIVPVLLRFRTTVTFKIVVICEPSHSNLFVAPPHQCGISFIAKWQSDFGRIFHIFTNGKKKVLMRHSWWNVHLGKRPQRCLGRGGGLLKKNPKTWGGWLDEPLFKMDQSSF